MITQLYRHFDKDGNLLYVGISLSAVNRLGQHKLASGWFWDIASITLENFDSREEAMAAEADAIRVELPIHNIRLTGEPPRPSRLQQMAQRSRELATENVVAFEAVYKPKEAADLLCCGVTHLNRLIDSGELGSFSWEGTRGGSLRITGWQIIDFLETKAAMANGDD